MVDSGPNATGPRPDPMPDHHHQARILVAEDSLVQAEIIRRTLVKHGLPLIMP